ncbi:MAG: SGNH/GDSL hydrolase family protein [Spirochaetales bacterium]|nr:SGNH/GDSL hydrolase family protein [Spirochaetales bacterium]
MRNILCYGDSNTWGFNPKTNGGRYEYHLRWTTVVQNLLKDKCRIIPEGLNSRTTAWDDPIRDGVNGKKYLLPCLLSHKPLDLVIIMLGTNDLKHRFNLSAFDISLGIGKLIDIVNKSECGPNGNNPEILILIPPEVRLLTNYKNEFGDCHLKSKELAKCYIDICNEKSVNYMEIGNFVRLGDTDGIHFETNQLPILGKIVADKIEQLLY